MKFPHWCLNQSHTGKGVQQQPSPPHGLTGKCPLYPPSKGRQENSRLLHDQSNTREHEQETHLNNFSRERLFMYEMLMRFPLRRPFFWFKGTTDGKLEWKDPDGWWWRGFPWSPYQDHKWTTYVQEYLYPQLFLPQRPFIGELLFVFVFFLSRGAFTYCGEG